MKKRLRRYLFFAVKTLTILILALGIYLYFGQYKSSHPYANLYSTLVTHFIDDISLHSPLRWVGRWFHVNPSHMEVNTQETVIRYKLKILAKSLNNYFHSLKQETTHILNTPSVARFITGQYYGGDETYALLESYLKGNTDILEVSLFDPQGKKLSTVRYQNVAEYTLHPQLLLRLKDDATLFVKNEQNDTLIHISKIEQGSRVIGFITQTVNKSFFTKILDHLEMDHRLFYLKNAHNEIIVDNYEAYQLISTQHQQSVPYLFYKHLTSLKTHAIPLGLKDTKYTLGVVIEENNTFGNVVALFMLFLFLYLAVTFLFVMTGKTKAIMKAMKLRRQKTSQKTQENNLPSVTPLNFERLSHDTISSLTSNHEASHASKAR